jgi:membrane fusion protein, copper/silver efflux system
MKRGIILFLISIVALLMNCKDQRNQAGIENGSYYTCPMHPSVRSSSPGSCPICNMSLIKVEVQDKTQETVNGNFVHLTARQQMLAGIKTDTARLHAITPTSTILGTVTVDEEQVTTISSRAKGRLDRLYIKTEGEQVRKGIPVYSIYSEELLADEKEFLSLIGKAGQSNSANSLIDEMRTASKNKLLLRGLTENQILELTKSENPSAHITFYSQASGYVTEVLIQEGAYVEEGTLLMELSGLTQVWVEAQVYTNENLADNNSFQIHSEAWPDEIYNGRLAFINPFIEEGRKIQLLRIRVENKYNHLIPGMMVYVGPSKITKPVLSVPKSAVLLEKMKTVWIRNDENTFEQRMVETGTENKHLLEITSGLKEGDIIVTEGAYAISGEFILKSRAGKKHEH